MKDRRFELDYLKGISIVAVVFIHTTGGALSLGEMENKNFGLNEQILLFLNILFKFSVPAFLFVSGLLFMYKFRNSSFSYTDFFKKRSALLLIPYFLWSLLGIVIAHFLIHPLTSWQFISTVIFGKGIFYQLYYIPLLFQFYLFVPLLFPFFKNEKLIKKFIICIVIFNVIYLGVYQFLFLTNFSLMPSSLIDLISLLIQPLFLSHLSYFLLGCLIGKNYEVYHKKIIKVKISRLFIVYIIAGFVTIMDSIYSYQISNDVLNSINFFRPSVLVYSFVSILLFYRVASEGKYMKRMFVFLGKYSLGIFLSHIFVLMILNQVSTVFFSNAITTVLSSFLIIFICLITNILISKIKINTQKTAADFVFGR